MKHYWTFVFALLVGTYSQSAEIVDEHVVNRKPAEEQKFDDSGNPLVKVEPLFFSRDEVSSTFKLRPYKDRRPEWTQTVALGYSQFSPVNYQPDFLAKTYDELYEEYQGMTELQINFKRNMSVGALGIEISAGSYSRESGGDDPGYLLKLTPVRLGAKFTLDTLYDEPYIAPYVGGGVYTIFYGEDSPNDASAVGGNTQVAGYYTVGAYFQIDWFDSRGAFESYTEAGIENSFLFIEGTKLLSSSAAEDPDFETDLYLAAGIAVEL